MAEYKLSFTGAEIDRKLGQIDNLVEKSELSSAVNTALAQAKASGEFDGEKGDTGAAGHSPVRGTDYWTPSDIAEIKSYVDEAILGVRGNEH